MDGLSTTLGSSLLHKKVSRFSSTMLQSSQIKIVTGMILLFIQCF